MTVRHPRAGSPTEPRRPSAHGLGVETALRGSDSCTLVKRGSCYGSGMPDFDSPQRARGEESAARVEVAARAEAVAPAGAAPAWPLGRTPVLADPPAQRRRLSAGQVLALQRAVGNRAVTGVVLPVAQRVAIKDPAMSETLYNSETAATGQATAGKYGLSPKYAMVRNGDTGVTVTVRIKFLNQLRNTVDPTAANAPAGTPSLGTLLGSPTEIPASDTRRAWAKETAEGAVKNWNGRLALVSEQRFPRKGPIVPKYLPVTFTSVAVFGLNEHADNQVIIHPSSIVAGSPGQPIDAGNWYLSKGNYSGDDKVIAAHEYGHLIGIADEYSQSNAQLNALIHQAAPKSAPSAKAPLDRATVERMVLSSLKQPLYDQLAGAMPAIAQGIRAQRPLVKKTMATAARTGVVDAGIRDSLRSQLAAASDAKVAANVPVVVATDTTKNFRDVADSSAGVEAGFSVAALTSQLQDAYWQALLGAQGAAVAVASFGDVSIDVASSVGNTTASGGANAAPASGLAAATVGPVASPGLPAVIPAASLEGRMAALPMTWELAGSKLATGITAAAFSAKMLAILKSAAAAAAAPLPAGVAPKPKLASNEALFERARGLISNAARGASRELAADLIRETMRPALAASIASLETAITAEVNRVMNTPAAGVQALGTPDPNMVALVAAMKTTLEANQKATKGTGRNPLGASANATVADQDVTYSYQGMMGSNTSRALRPDQFQRFVDHFNAKLMHRFEKKFKPEVK